MLIDLQAHLSLPQFDRDRGEVVCRAGYFTPARQSPGRGLSISTPAKRNESAYLRCFPEKIAEIRDGSFGTSAPIPSEKAREFLGRDVKGR